MSDTLPPRWYVVDRDGLATLCKDEEDAKNTAADVRVAFPRRRPYRAVLLGDVAAERERCAKVCEPKGKRPCDCTNCDCGNSTDARMVAEWDEAMARATAIRAG